MFETFQWSAFVSAQKSLQNLQDASDDLMMLDDDTLLIPYQIGNVFVSHSQEETQEMLEAAKVGFLKYLHLLFRRVIISERTPPDKGLLSKI